MRKKIIYGILFLTLFLVSTASMAQPVAGYERGLPKEALGVEQVSEIKIFNEDEWEKCVGAGGQGPDDIYSGDADVVGARSLTIFREYEDEEKKNFVGDKAMASGTQPEMMNLGLRQGIAELIDPTGALWVDETLSPGYCLQKPALIAMPYGAVMTAAWVMAGNPSGSAATELNNTILFLAGAAMAGPLMDMDTLIDLYTSSIEMSVVKRDKWDFNKDWETDEDFGDPDKADLEWDDKVDGWGPIPMDPRDPDAMVRDLVSVKKAQQAQLLAFHTKAMAPFKYFFNGALGYPTPTGRNFTTFSALNYTALNNSIAIAAGGNLPKLLAMANPKDWSALGGPVSAVDDLIMVVFPALDVAISSMYYILDALYFESEPAMIASLGHGGLPIGVPADDFVTRMLKEFNIKDDQLYRVPYATYGKDLPTDTAICPVGAPEETVNPIEYGRTSLLLGAPLGGETVHVNAYWDIEYDGANTITVKIEWPDNTIDPKDMVIFGGDGKDELKDFEIIITVADMGGVGTSTWTRGDTILWQKGGIDQIPGYEITILLGVSGISVLAVVYVIMKKRKR